MKLRVYVCWLLILLGFLHLYSCSNPQNATFSTSPKSNTTDSNNAPNDTFSENINSKDKEKVMSMFVTNGVYSNGTYYFRKYSETGNCSFLYSFSYKPEIDMFHCSLLVTTNIQGSTLYDYGSVTFTWNNFETALYYGYHEFDYRESETSPSIHFDFSVSNPQPNISFANYKYSVRSNSFKNLTNKKDIDSYAQTCFDCINQSLLYSQSVLYSYTSTVTLW